MPNLQTTPQPSRTELLTGIIGTTILGTVVLLIKSPLLLFVLCALVFGSIAVWYTREYFPLLLFLLLPFSLELQIASTTRLTVPTEIMIPVLCLIFAGSVFTSGKIMYRTSSLNIAVLLMYLVMLCSIFITVAPITTYKALIRETGYIITGYYLIPLFVNSELRLKYLVFGSIITHTLLVIYGFCTQIVMGIKIYGEIGYPFFTEHCIYAAYITFSFSILLAFALDYHKKNPNLLPAGISLLFAAAIVLTFVRAAWLSIFVLLLFYLFQFRKRRSAVNLILVILAFVLLSAGLLITTKIGSLLMQRIDTIADLNYVANYDRLDRWTAAWEIWEDYPWSGIGWGVYPDMYFYYRTYADAFSGWERMGAHNLYLELMAESGIFGLLAYLFMIFMFFRQGFKLLRRLQSSFLKIFLIGIQGGMITYLVHAFVNNLGPSDKMSITFWVSFGMIPVLSHLADLEQKAEKETKKNDAIPAVPGQPNAGTAALHLNDPK